MLTFLTDWVAYQLDWMVPLQSGFKLRVQWTSHARVVPHIVPLRSSLAVGAGLRRTLAQT